MADLSDALATLQQSSVGRGLQRSELARVMTVGQLVTLQPGAVILRQFDSADAVYLPCSGMVMVERSALNGRRQVIDFLHRGDYLGFTATEKYLYSASALERSTLLRFARPRFVEACDDIPQLKQNMADINNLVLAGLLDHLFAIGQKRAHERLAFLIHQMQVRKVGAERDGLIALPMSRTDIGDYLGLTLETTSRAFSRLRNEGVITTPDHHSVRVEDQAALDELAEVE